LRPFKQEDLDPFSEIVSDPDVMLHATYHGTPMTRAQAWNWLCLMLGHWHMRGFGIWAVEEKSSQKLIGRIGLQFLDWFDDVELVWMLSRSYWGKGLAQEGVREAIRFGFECLELPRLTAVIGVENKRSIRLAEKLGMIKEREITRQEKPFLEFSLQNDFLDME
jgi:RimJ/RimL family protein N-acetyltransferase